MKEYVYQYNHYYALLPKPYQAISTFERWYQDYTYGSVVKMNALDLSS